MHRAKRTFSEQMVIIVGKLAWTNHMVVEGPERLHLPQYQIQSVSKHHLHENITLLEQNL